MKDLSISKPVPYVHVISILGTKKTFYKKLITILFRQLVSGFKKAVIFFFEKERNKTTTAITTTTLQIGQW